MLSGRVLDYCILIENLKRAYGNNIVLHNVNLAVRPGEFVTLVGPSGCGKSTLLRLLLGAEAPDQGSVKIDGQLKSQPGRDCGIVYQKYSLLSYLNVLENVAIGLIFGNSGIPERIITSALQRVGIRLPYLGREKAYFDLAKEYLERVGLAEVEEQYPHQLSGGMQQRVAIAQALIVQPKVLLLDEPFSALDSWTRKELQIFLLELWARDHMTIFFITHDLEEAIYLGTRIIVLAPYCSNSSGKSEGSRIIADLPIGGEHIRPLSFKTSDIFNGIFSRVTNLAFGGDRPRHSGELILEHPDCF